MMVQGWSARRIVCLSAQRRHDSCDRGALNCPDLSEGSNVWETGAYGKDRKPDHDALPAAA